MVFVFDSVPLTPAGKGAAGAPRMWGVGGVVPVA